MPLSDEIRCEFPILAAGGTSKPLIYLDSAATALKPQCVIDAVTDVLAHKTANIHRSVHRLGDMATEAYENSRQTVADFIGAEAHEIVFLRNTTEALNLVARGQCWSGKTLVSIGEHHSNILPWTNQVQRLSPRRDGTLDMNALQAALESGEIGLVSVAQESNVLGVQNDVAELAKLCHAHGALLAVDAAQSVPHQPIDVFELDCDFLAFSGHKMGAPTGVGVLYGKAEHLERIDWHLRGGATVDEVHAEDVKPKEIPWRFEAGTPAVESVCGLAAAMDFLSQFGMQRVHEQQIELVNFAMQLIAQELPSMTVLGPRDQQRSGAISLVQRVVSPHLLARGLSDGNGICVRSGFHCAQPLHEHLGVPASLRLSFYIYNTPQEIETTIDAIKKLMAVG